MTSVDLLLYRPWSDASKKLQEKPVDFSKKSRTKESSDQVEGYTDIEETSKITSNISSGDNIFRTKSELKVHSGECVDESRTVDSGFSSPSDGAYVGSYQHILPGLCQQALVNHALQNEVLYRDALQRELINRHHEDLRDRKHQISFEKEQMAPLALVVKRKYPASSDGEEETFSNYSGSEYNRFVKRQRFISESGETVSSEGSKYEEGKGDSDVSSNINVSDVDLECENTAEGNKGSGNAGVDNGPRTVPPPQTSPYHLLPPALYWPHGSTPFLHQLTKPIKNPFNNYVNSGIEHRISNPLPSPNTALSSTNNLFSVVNNQMSSPINRHLSNSLPSPGTSRSAYDLSISMNNASNSNSKLSPRTNTPIKSPAKSPISSAFKRKSPNIQSNDKKSKSPKKTKATRRLNFDEDKTSPVSGTIIRELVDGEEPLVVRKGDIDPAYNVVEITEEAKTELAKIDNKIGDYVCRLCKELYDDAFGLAQHRCSRIIHVEYRCPECDKVFNCPANLASHRRWHKPKGTATNNSKSNAESKTNASATVPNNISEPSTSKSVYDEEINTEDNNGEETDGDSYDCHICFKTFKRQAYLRKHLSTHRRDSEEPTTSDNVIQPVPQKHPMHQMHPQLPPSGIPQTHPGVVHPTLVSPLSPPMLSPPFSPTELLKCHMCPLTFYTPAALTIHFATTHRRDTRNESSFSASQKFMELALGNMPSTSGLINSGNLHIPRPQYVSGQSSHVPAHLLHRPSQISAPS